MIQRTSESTFRVVQKGAVSIELFKKMLSLKRQYEAHESVISVQLGYNELHIECSDMGVMDLEFKPVVDEIITRLVRIPVCYELGKDMDHLSEQLKLDREAIKTIHTSGLYPVHMIGFIFGFPYLSGLDERLHIARKSVPELKIEAGSVGIGGSQTGIYPANSPGGWHIIGKTPVKLYSLDEADTLIRPGDLVEFYAISLEDYQTYKQGEVEIIEKRI
jgi:KipI family sensor histidine kinase inhibitor